MALAVSYPNQSYGTNKACSPMQNTVPKPIWLDYDIDMAPILARKVGIVGYGNQGRPHALNLRDSGCTVAVSGRSGSVRLAQAEADGFKTFDYTDITQWADVLMMMLPDDTMAEVISREFEPHLRSGQFIGFCHGLVIHEKWWQPPANLNVFMVAPKAQGRGVRNKYVAGSGVPGLVAVHQDICGETEALARAYAKAIGCARAGVMPTTFAEETICDLFSEQAVLCGGLTSLIKTAFETLVEAGFSPEVAYFECLYEVKLIADLLHERGITGMRQAISSTALYGDVTQGARIIDGHVRESMRQTLANITNGLFARAMQHEFLHGKPTLNTAVEADYHHGIEQTHRHLRNRAKF